MTPKHRMTVTNHYVTHDGQNHNIWMRRVSYILDRTETIISELKKCTTDSSDYLPSKMVKMRGHDFLMPRKTTEILCKFWGNDWRIPIKGGSIMQERLYIRALENNFNFIVFNFIVFNFIVFKSTMQSLNSTMGSG